MADVFTVAIKLKAVNDDFNRGMTKSGDETSKFGKTAAAGLAVAGVAAVAFARNAAGAYVDYGKAMIGLSRVSGENIEVSSRMNFAAQQSGVTTEALTMGIKFLEKNMAAANPQFAKMGVSVRDSSGHLRGAHDVLLDTADAIAKMSNGAEKTDAILKLFGRSGLALGPMLNRGRAGILALEQEATKYGLVLTQDNLPALSEAIAANRRLDASMLGLKVRVGQEVLPVFTKFTEILAGLPGPVMSVGPPLIIGAAGLGMIAVKGKQFYDVMAKVGPKVGELAGKIPHLGSAAAGAGVAVGGAVAVYAIWNARMQEAYANAKKLGDAVTEANQSGTFSEMGDRLGKVDEQIRGIDAAIADSSAPWDADYRAELEAYKTTLLSANEASRDQIGIIGDMAGATGKSKDEMKAWLDNEARAGRTYATGALAIAAYTGKIDRHAMSTQEAATAIEALTAKTKEANDAAKAELDPQFGFIDATRKQEDAQRAVGTAERALEDSHRAVATAQDGVVKADQRRLDAARKLTDAVQTQREAQRALNDLLAGPSLDEKDNIESAAIGLEEAKRRAAGITTADPALEKRRNALDVRRAEATLGQALGAHDKAIADARKDLASADQAVNDARAEQVEAAAGVVDANKAVEDAVRKVDEAERGVGDAQINAAKAAADLDTATRNLNSAYETGAIPIDGSKDALKRWQDQGFLTAAQAWEVAKAFTAAKAAAEGNDPNAAAAGVGPQGPLQGPPSADPTAANKGFPVELATDQALVAEYARRHPGDKPVGPRWAYDWLKKNRAMGGPLDDGWTMVGEEGPELVFKQGAAAHVNSAPRTRGLLAAHPLPGAAPGASEAGSGGFHHHGDIVIGKATTSTAWDIQWAQRKLALALTVPRP